MKKSAGISVYLRDIYYLCRHEMALEKTEVTLSEIKMKLSVTQSANEPVCKEIPS